MVRRKYISIILSIMMIFAGVCTVEAVMPQSVITAYAASITAPKVTASNASATSVKLKWKKVKSAKKYVVYRSTSKSKGYKAVKTIKNASTVTYTSSKLTCGKTYYFKVEAVNGKKKATSKVVKITALPPVPTSVKVKSDKCGKNTISYKKSSGATGYEIYFSKKKSGTYELLATTKKTSYTHNIGVGKTGYYKVKAYTKVNSKKKKSALTSAVKGKALEHSFGSYIIDVMPTCSTKGSKYSTCSVCGTKDVRKIDATGEHRYINTVVEPDCTKRGYTNHKCSYCGKSYNDKYKDAKGHTYVEKVTEPTCTQSGHSTFICSACKSSYTDKYTLPLGHSMNYTLIVEPSCISEGKRYCFCDNCDLGYDETIDKIPHNYGRVETVKEPTCNEDGEVIMYCITDGCDESIECGLDRLPHEYVFVTDEDHSESHCEQCKNCGRTKYNSDEAWQNCDFIGEIVELDGEQYSRIYCPICGNELFFEPVNNDCPHEETFVMEAVDATCEEAGYSESVICNDCFTVITSATVIAPLGHDFEITQAAVAPTCTENGKTAVETCTICGEERGGIVTADMIATGHDYQTKTVPANCTDNGFKALVCTKCNDVIKETKSEIVRKSGHALVYKNDTDEGYKVYECSTCHEIETDTTCYINLDTKDISVKSVAKFTKSASGNDKLLLTYDGTSDYEITGSAKNLIIDLDVPDVDSTKECDIKLAGVDITNDTLDILNIKNQTAESVKVKVSISAKVDTVNKLTTLTDGNAIDSNCSLTLKGRGKLILNTAATSISCGAKLVIKNLTLDITSAKRGIDLEAKAADGSSDYYNLELAGNANIKITSADDGIRCKNFDANKLDADEIDSIVVINSTDGDGIDAKGDSQNRKSVILHSGRFTITAGKKVINVDNKKGGQIFDNDPIIDGTATLNKK